MNKQQANQAVENSLSTGRPGRRQRGATLLEVIAYLAVASVVVFGAASMFGRAFSASNSNLVSEQVTQLRTAIRQYSFTQPAAAMDEATLLAIRGVPPSITNSGTAAAPVLNGAHGGTFLIGGTAAAPTIQVNNLAPESCTQLLLGMNNAGTFTAVSVGATSNAALTTSTAIALPLTAAAINTACGAANRSVVFTG